jgi:DNA invertase Pin-like site-specific DNA recombinase
VYFETEDLSTSNTKYDFLISILQSVAQAESESRSQNIKWGNKRKLEDGSSKTYGRICYGYQHDDEGQR